jgi:tripartite-type tricarboxylate transporter receptor subunit TctC
VRKWIATSIGLALLAGGTAQGQTSKAVYPNRPVRMIVPFGAGGPGDIFARLIGQKLSQQLGQQFVIENRPGAGGNIGAGVAARAPADGYTLLVGSSTLWVNAILYPQIPYDPVRDFEPIIIGATSREVLVVHPSVPAKTVQELVAYSISNTQTILRAARPARALRLSLRGGRSLQQS